MFVAQLTLGWKILQTAQFDDRSDDKGLEVESMTLATVCGKTFMFLGAERTSTIFIFDITDPTSPVLHSHISAAGNTDMAPSEAFAITPEPRPNFNQGQASQNICLMQIYVEIGKELLQFTNNNLFARLTLK